MQDMALRNRVLRKYASFYSRMRITEGSDSDASTLRPSAGTQACSSASFTWLHRACSLNGSSTAAVPSHVPLSESPKRELRMRSVTKVGRQSKKQRKHFPKAWW